MVGRRRPRRPRRGLLPDHSAPIEPVFYASYGKDNAAAYWMMSFGLRRAGGDPLRPEHSNPYVLGVLLAEATRVLDVVGRGAFPNVVVDEAPASDDGRDAAVAAAACAACGRSLAPGDAFCAGCGTPASRRSDTCARCGVSYDAGAAFCSSCGHRLDR